MGAFLLAWSLLECVGQRPPRAPAAEVAEYPLSTFTLANGLSVVLEKSADTGAAGVVLMVGAGSADEPPEKAGLAHLVEHLVFYNHAQAEPDLKRQLNQCAGSWNAWTNWDATTFASYGPAGALEPLLRLTSSVLEHPLLGVGPAELAHELDIVDDERQLRAENGTPTQALGWLAASVFPETFGYAHPVVGTRNSIAGLQLQDAEEFVRSGYLPAHATLAVTSSLDLAAQRALVEQTFGKIPGSSAAQQLAPIAEAPVVRVGPSGPPTVHPALSANPELFVGWSVPSGLSSQGAIAPLLAQLIDGSLLQTGKVHGVINVRADYLEGARSDLFYLM